MKKANNLKAQNIDQPKDLRDPLAAIEEVIVKAGGVSALARAIGVPTAEINNWKKKGAVPMNRAMIITLFYGTPWTKLVYDENEMWYIIAGLEDSLKDFYYALGKIREVTEEVYETMIKLGLDSSEIT